MLSVIIGRFQTPYLHQGHLQLIEEAHKHGTATLVLIGTTAATGTNKNPLDFDSRRNLFLSHGICQHLDIKPLSDCLSDKDWSDSVDKIIADLGFDEATIFGGRDNSIENCYSGKHSIKIIDSVGMHSATRLRQQCVRHPIKNSDFRAGIIYATENRYPIVYSTVDIIVKNNDKYLVGKKGDKYCFVGGFVDACDDSTEAAALRELEEETGITNFGDIDYYGSIKIDDPRYRGTKDCIMTHCFLVRNAKNGLGDTIKDKEFKHFVWATREELEELLYDFHKPLLTLIK